jgi:hypothetical protein
MTPNWYEPHILPAALDFACGMPMILRMRQLSVRRSEPFMASIAGWVRRLISEKACY